MENSDGPREWWIAFNTSHDDDFLECYKRYVTGPEGFNNLMPHEIGIHVIEKSAYDSAVKMRDEYLSRLQEKCDDVLALSARVRELEAEVAELKAYDVRRRL